MTQKQVRKESQVSDRTAADQEEIPVKDQSEARESLEGVDELLDEIDALLEENAAEFVASYVQQGGQ